MEGEGQLQQGADTDSGRLSEDCGPPNYCCLLTDTLKHEEFDVDLLRDSGVTHSLFNTGRMVLSSTYLT